MKIPRSTPSRINEWFSISSVKRMCTSSPLLAPPPLYIPGIFFALSPDVPMKEPCVQQHVERKAESTVCFMECTHPLFASGNIAEG